MYLTYVSEFLPPFSRRARPGRGTGGIAPCTRLGEAGVAGAEPQRRRGHVDSVQGGNLGRGDGSRPRSPVGECG